MIISRALAAGVAAAAALACCGAAAAMSEAEAWAACGDQTQPNSLDSLMQSCVSDSGCAGVSNGPNLDQIIAGCSAIAASPDEPGIRRALASFQLGSVHSLRQSHAQAISDFGAAIRYRPDFSQAFDRRAEEYVAVRDYPHALADFSQAIRLQPTLIRAYVGRGKAYYEIHDYDHAIIDATQALAVKPDNAAALNERCWVRAAANRDLPAALADCDRAAALAPGVPNTYGSRGFVHLRMGDYPAAIRDYGVVLGLAGVRVDVRAMSFYGRGLARIGAGDRKGGQDDIAAARALDADAGRDYAQAGLKP